MAKLSESLRNYVLDTGSLKTALTGFAVTFFNGTVPILASDAVIGSTLAVFTVNNDGITGATWGTATTGLLARTPTEAMSATCLIGGSPTFYRIHKLSESATTANTTFYRMQGTLGVANADGILDSTFFPMVLGTVYPLGNVVVPSYVGS